ncbi:MAG: hypothetical protein V4492_01140 [Chlamydiota bacterium]
MKPIDRLFSEMADHSKSLAHLQKDYLSSLMDDLDRFLKTTKDLTKQMKWQGWTVVALTSFSAAFAVAGSLFSKTNNPLPARFLDKIKTSDFLRQTCQAAAKFFHGITSPVEIFFRGKTTVTESLRTLIERVGISENQGSKSHWTSQMQNIHQTMLRILESAGKSS